MNNLDSLGSRRVQGVRKIAVLRANAIGDYTFALPALESLRAAYPQAEIVLLGQDWHAGFLAGRPGPVDRVIAVPPCRGVYEPRGNGWRDEPAALQAFFARMRAERFDLALQLHGGGRFSNPFVKQLGARLAAGLRAPDAEPLDRWLPYVYFQSEISRYLEAVALVGAAPVTLEPRLAVTGRDLADAAAVVAENGRALVALHPGVGHPMRQWPPEKFAAVADALAATGARVVLTGTAEERATVDAVLAATGAEVQDTCGQLTLEGMLGLLSRCSLVISNDSGPLHLAAAVGVPTVGIYWCGNMVTAALALRARHRPAISWRLDCPQCGAHVIHNPCEHPVSFVEDVKVEEVLAAAEEVQSPEPGVRSPGSGVDGDSRA